jgi:hypothetical protein
VNDDELFTRLLYVGTAQLGLSVDETWLTPFGLLLDLRESHLLWHGAAKPKREYTLDDIF